MNLIIQIPCFNEQDNLQEVIGHLPAKIDGIDKIEYLVIDDGSTDDTVKIANNLGVHHVIQFPSNRGLASAFMAGLKYSLKASADIIVNTDGDNQYKGEDIPKLIKPILNEQCDIVIGARDVKNIKSFSLLKKFLQLLGSWVVRVVSKTKVKDAPSGFRAYSRKAASQLYVFNSYTYTIETIIQAGLSGFKIEQIPIITNPTKRSSRLVKNLFSYVKRSLVIMIRVFIIYRPLYFFGVIGSILFTIGTLIGVRFLFFYLAGDGDGHIQSLILSSILIGIGFQTLIMALVSDLISANRKLIQELRSDSLSQ